MTSIILTLITCFGPLNPTFGLVFHDGRHQFDWLIDLEKRQPGKIDAAISGTCALLSEHRFTCRSTMIPALAACGPQARVALPVLRRLLNDDEALVRKAAADAIAKIESEN